MDLGEVHNIKGHPKRCSMQILSSTVAENSWVVMIEIAKEIMQKKL